MEIIFKDNSIVINGVEYPLYFEISYTRTFKSTLEHIYSQDAVVTVDGYKIDILKDGRHTATLLQPIVFDITVIIKALPLLTNPAVKYEVCPIKYNPDQLTIDILDNTYTNISTNYDTIYRTLEAIAIEKTIEPPVAEPEQVIEEPEVNEEVEEEIPTEAEPEVTPESETESVEEPVDESEELDEINEETPDEESDKEGE